METFTKEQLQGKYRDELRRIAARRCVHQRVGDRLRSKAELVEAIWQDIVRRRPQEVQPAAVPEVQPVQPAANASIDVVQPNGCSKRKADLM
jgi:hypothetical protein